MGTKKELGRERALQATNQTATHGAHAANIMSPERDEALAFRSSGDPAELSRLREDFDRMLEAMQSPHALAVAKGLMTISSEALRATLRRTQTAPSGRGEPVARPARRKLRKKTLEVITVQASRCRPD